LSHYHISLVGSLPQLLALLPYSLAGIDGRMERETVVIVTDKLLIYVFLVYKCYGLHTNVFVFVQGYNVRKNLRNRFLLGYFLPLPYSF